MAGASPTAIAPALTLAQTYRQIQRYRSATLYGDGNGLGVIDSEMPNIRRRLGVWRPGMTLPLPPHCPRLHLVRTALWCGPAIFWSRRRRPSGQGCIFR